MEVLVDPLCLFTADRSLLHIPSLIQSTLFNEDINNQCWWWMKKEGTCTYQSGAISSAAAGGGCRQALIASSSLLCHNKTATAAAAAAAPCSGKDELAKWSTGTFISPSPLKDVMRMYRNKEKNCKHCVLIDSVH